MRNQTITPEPQRLKAPKVQKLKAVFDLVKLENNKKTLVCSGLTGEQVTSLIDSLNTPIIVKFAGMRSVL